MSRARRKGETLFQCWKLLRVPTENLLLSLSSSHALAFAFPSVFLLPLSSQPASRPRATFSANGSRGRVAADTSVGRKATKAFREVQLATHGVYREEFCVS